MRKILLKPVMGVCAWRRLGITGPPHFASRRVIVLGALVVAERVRGGLVVGAQLHALYYLGDVGDGLAPDQLVQHLLRYLAWAEKL